MSSWMSASSSPNRNFGQRLGQLGLTDTGRAGEDERAGRALRVLQAGAGAADRLRDRLDRLLLADDPLVQLVLHAQQTGGLLLGQLEHRDAGPVGQHLGDLLVVDLGDDVQVAGLPLLLPLAPSAPSSCFSVSRRLRGPLEVLRVDRRLLVPAHARRSSRRTRAGPAARSSGGCASGRRPRRSGRSPCPAGTGRRCSGRPAWPPRPAPRR